MINMNFYMHRNSLVVQWLGLCANVLQAARHGQKKKEQHAEVTGQPCNAGWWADWRAE